jgi:hypothetical protein
MTWMPNRIGRAELYQSGFQYSFLVAPSGRIGDAVGIIADTGPGGSTVKRL